MFHIILYCRILIIRFSYMGCLGVIGIISTQFGVISILPQIAEYYKINIATAGYLLSAFALMITLTVPFMVLYLYGFVSVKI